MSKPTRSPFLRAFESPEEHQAIASIIRRRSINKEDVREVLLRGLDLSFAHNILDLGCGFGFMAEAVAGRVAQDACLTGIDACAAYEIHFVRRVEAFGRRARFIPLRVDSRLPYTDGSFDVVICSYSLYFFIEALQDLPRILARDGVMLILTHSARSAGGLLTAAGIDPEQSMLTSIVGRFPAEDAGEALGRHFERVERVDYPNELRFHPEDRDEIFAYLRFKLPMIEPEGTASDEVPESMRRSIECWLDEHGELVVEKSDAGFRCWDPRRPAGP